MVSPLTLGKMPGTMRRAVCFHMGAVVRGVHRCYLHPVVNPVLMSDVWEVYGGN